MSDRTEAGEWIPLMVYAMKRGVSLSTLRRHIKSNKIQYKIENGRYLVLDNSAPAELPREEAESSVFLQTKLQKLERDLRKAQEEIAELKMLVALYEEKIVPQRMGG